MDCDSHPLRRSFIFLLLTAIASALFAADAQAGPFPLTGTTSVSYSNPIGGSITSSGLGGSGVMFNDNYNQPLAAATIAYTNNPTNNVPNQVTLQVETNYTTFGGAKGAADFDFTLDLTKTSNSGITLSVPVQYSTGANIGNDGSTTYMQFLGFGSGTVPPQTLSPTLSAGLNSSSSAFLWVQFIVVEPESQKPLTGGGGGTPSIPLSAPEPAAWLLALVGCGLFFCAKLVQLRSSRIGIPVSISAVGRF
jgi:hypothetical protein